MGAVDSCWGATWLRAAGELDLSNLGFVRIFKTLTTSPDTALRALGAGSPYAPQFHAKPRHPKSKAMTTGAAVVVKLRGLLCGK